ncbi:MAG: hypothetical protein II942_04275 [Alphaproteobacteria bacterium]|nr:hypothetical protein [Alphaproteobacteria bacterium]
MFLLQFHPIRNIPKSLSSDEVFIQLQDKYSHDTEQSILSLLRPLVGDNKVRASVRVQLNLKNGHTNHKQWQPNTEQPITTTQTLENNIQTLIEQQHISVVIDGETKDGVYQARTPQEMEKIRRLVYSAVGFNSTRGDTVEIQNMPFIQYTEPTQRHFSVNVCWMIILAILIVFLLLMFYGCRRNCSAYSKQNEPSTDPAEYITQNINRAIAVMKNWLYMPINTRKTDWTPVQKVGIILLALDEQSVRKTLVAFDDEEVRLVAKTMTTLGVIPPQESRRLLNELETDMRNGSAVVGNQARVRQILSDTLDQNTLHLTNTLPPEQPALWKELSEMDTDLLSNRLDDYPPESIAYVLYHLPTQKAGDVMTGISADKTTQILIHLSHIGHVNAQTANKLEQRAIEIAHLILDSANIPSGTDKASEILANLSHTNTGTQIWQNLTATDPDLARQITGKLMRFQDIAHWPDKTIQTLLRYTLRTTALTALIHADPEVVGAISRNVPQNVWTKLVEEMNARKNTTDAEIQTAQRCMIQTAQDLLRQGKIEI